MSNVVKGNRTASEIKTNQKFSLRDSQDEDKRVRVSSEGEIRTEDYINQVSTPIHTQVGTSPVRVDGPVLAGRKKVDIQVNKDLYIGFDNSITTTSGYYLFLRKGQSVSLDFGDQVQLWAVSKNSGNPSDVVLTQGKR